MATFPVVDIRSRVLPRHTPGPGASAVTSAADLLFQHSEQQRREALEGERIDEQRDFQRELTGIEDRLARGRMQFQHDLQRPFMETPQDRHTRALEALRTQSGLSREEFDHRFFKELPFRERAALLDERRFGLQQELGRGQLGVSRDDLALRRELGVGGLALDRERVDLLRERQQAELRGSGAGGGFPHQIISGAVRSPYDLRMFAEDPELRQGLEDLHQFFGTGQFPAQEPETGEAGRLPPVFARPPAGRSREGGALGPGALTPGGDTPGVSPTIGMGGRSATGGGAPDSPINTIPDSLFTGMGAEEHASFLSRGVLPERTAAEYIERLRSLDPALAQEVERLMAGGG